MILVRLKNAQEYAPLNCNILSNLRILPNLNPRPDFAAFLREFQIQNGNPFMKVQLPDPALTPSQRSPHHAEIPFLEVSEGQTHMVRGPA